MGLRNLVCLLPHRDDDEEEEAEEQPGTSYNSREAHRERRVSCSSEMLACFRAGAINLIVQPAMAMGGQRQVQPVTSLPRTAFLDGHESGDDPTSPVVSCIGQVKKDKPAKTTPPKGGEVWSLKAKKEKDPTLSSPRPSKWKQILGARGTVNPSQQPRTEETEFHIDLNRFGSSMQDQAVTPGFGHMNNGARTFPASTFGSSMQDQAVTPGFGHMNNGARTFPASTFGSSMQDQAVTPGFGHINNGARTFPASTFEVEPALESPPVKPEVLLWQRRTGACQPVALEVKRRVLKSNFR